MEYQTLFNVAPESVTVSARWTWPNGWRVTVWSSTTTPVESIQRLETYQDLSSEELLDVITVEIASRLGIKD